MSNTIKKTVQTPNAHLLSHPVFIPQPNWEKLGFSPPGSGDDRN